MEDLIRMVNTRLKSHHLGTWDIGVGDLWRNGYAETGSTVPLFGFWRRVQLLNKLCLLCQSHSLYIHTHINICIYIYIFAVNKRGAAICIGC